MESQVLLESPPLPLERQDSGAIVVVGTRVPLEAIVYAFLDGCSVEQIAEDFPTVGLAAAYAVVAYYLTRREEIDAYVAERERTAQEVRRQNEARFPRTGVRERLLARRDGRLPA